MLRILLALAGIMSLSSVVQALTFQAAVDETEWRLTPSIFECIFVQPIPDYGEAVFYHEAGEDLMFHLKVKKNLMGAGRAALHIEPPHWKPSHIGEDLGLIEIKRSSHPLKVDPIRANKMMQGLLKGMHPTITRKAYYDEAEPIRVAVSAANFKSFYKDYLGCVTGLLPVNYRQVAKSRVFFASGQKGLDAKSKKKLDLIILYVKADPRVNAIYVDGHSDSGGRRYHNRRLSEDRANKVSDYLVKKGVDGGMITTRYHGERYPVASNKTRAGRNLNRRVTVRLERVDEDGEVSDFTF